jgi:hypothetical protein
MFSEKSLTKENLIAFLKEKGLYEECGEWCQPRFVQQEKDKAAKKAAEPVWKRNFRWEGHHTRCCYECSGERFDDSNYWGHFVTNMDLLPFDFYDPSEDGPADTDENSVLLKECPTFKKLCEKMLKFVDGELDEDVDRCYDFDKFGFDNPPSNDQLIEWLGNLVISKKDAEDPASETWEDCFVGPSF